MWHSTHVIKPHHLHLFRLPVLTVCVSYINDHVPALTIGFCVACLSLIPLTYKHCESLYSHYDSDHKNYFQYDCKNGDYETLASLSIPGQEGVIRHLFAMDSAEFKLPAMCIFICFYFPFMALCAGMAAPIGTFIPNLMLGALNGRIIGEIVEVIFGNKPVSSPGVFALIGAAAQLSAWTRTVVCVVVTLAEITGNVDLILPMGMCCIVARQVSIRVAYHSFSHAQATIEHVIEPPSVKSTIEDMQSDIDSEK